MLAVGMSVYIFIGVYHEEKDLISEFGKKYRATLIPRPGFSPGLQARKSKPTLYWVMIDKQ